MPKKIILLLFLFSGFILSSQNGLSLDSLITKDRITPYLHYYQDISESETLASIKEKEFSIYGDKVFIGEQKQKFWFSLRLEKSEKYQGEFFFLLNTVAIDKIIIYQDFGSGYQKKYEFQKNGQKNIEIPFSFENDAFFLFEVSFGNSIYFPIQIKDKQNLEKYHNTNLVVYGLYYGFALIVLLINLFFFWQTKERFFIYYSL